MEVVNILNDLKANGQSWVGKITKKHDQTVFQGVELRVNVVRQVDTLDRYKKD